MKSSFFMPLLLIALLFLHSHAQNQHIRVAQETVTNNTNGETNGTTNGETNGTTNQTTNGQTVQEIECKKICEELSFETCTLCSQTCRNISNTEVTSFKLTTCELKQCKLWKPEPRSQQEPTNTEIICAEWQTKLLSEQQCGPSCCDQEFQTFTFENYQKCVAINNQHSSSDMKVSVIVGIVLSSVLGSIVIFVILICCRKNIALCCKNFAYCFTSICIKYDIKKPKSQGSTDESDHNEHNHQENQNLKWTAVRVKKQLTQLPTSKYIIQSQYEINPEVYCSICLDSGLNTETHCDHHFHFACLRPKMAKKLICPECKSKEFNPLIINCDICMEKQTKFVMNKNNADFQLPQFFINNKIYCDTCIQSGHIKRKPKAQTKKTAKNEHKQIHQDKKPKQQKQK